MDINYRVEGRIMPSVDRARIDESEQLNEGLVAAVIQGIAHEIEVTVGGVTMHLAGWQDPDHWVDEWRKLGVEDPWEFLAQAGAS